MAKQTGSINSILDRLSASARKRRSLSVGEIAEALGSRSYGPFLLFPAMLEMTPFGSIPGIPTLLASIVLLFAVQIVIGRRHIWVPSFIANRRLSTRKLQRAIRKGRGFAGTLDSWFYGRLSFLVQPPFVQAAAVLAILLALAVPPLEIIPFATTVPMSAIAVLGLALLVHDGLLIILAGCLAVATVAFGITLA